MNKFEPITYIAKFAHSYSIYSIIYNSSRSSFCSFIKYLVLYVHFWSSRKHIVSSFRYHSSRIIHKR
nr:MAG TPA: hypothetical protein [Caudoviricetes sp.]